MHRVFRSDTIRRLVIAVLLICVVGLVLAGGLKWAKFNPSANSEIRLIAEETAQTSRQTRSSIVLSNLTRFGFEPAAIRVPAGRCLLAIRNISGKETLELQVKREGNGQTLLAEQHRTGKRHWEKFVEFEAGEYLITEAGNPSWTLRLTVFSAEKQ